VTLFTLGCILFLAGAVWVYFIPWPHVNQQRRDAVTCGFLLILASLMIIFGALWEVAGWFWGLVLT